MVLTTVLILFCNSGSENTISSLTTYLFPVYFLLLLSILIFLGYLSTTILLNLSQVKLTWFLQVLYLYKFLLLLQAKSLTKLVPKYTQLLLLLSILKQT